MDDQKKEKFYLEVSRLVHKAVSPTTLISSLKLDSMTRSEVIFLIEDIWGKDCWGMRVSDFVTFEEMLGHAGIA
jgi:hypothetical protein